MKLVEQKYYKLVDSKGLSLSFKVFLLKNQMLHLLQAKY
jgi:hypothetical protein